MKKILILSASLAAFSVLHAQDYRVKLGNSADKKVVLSIDNSKVRIEGHDGDEVIITGTGMKEMPKRAEGLKPLYYNAVDNSGFGLSVNTQGNIVNITKASRQDINYIIKVPRKAAINYEEINFTGSDHIMIMNMQGDLEVESKNSDIQLLNVSGPVVASSTSGDITVTFVNMNAAKPSSISNISGFVDVTLPTSTKANVKLKSISGEIYSDLDITLPGEKKDMKRYGGGHQVEGTLNGGGVSLDFRNISGDIYLRKAK